VKAPNPKISQVFFFTAFATLVWCALPPHVICLGDDFGYYRSVLATAFKARPWTDEWLEPWAASLSTLSAVIFSFTGSFKMATHGLQALLAGVSLVGSMALLRRQGASTLSAALLGVLFLTNPTLFWKEIEFTGMVLYLPCLIGALYAVEARRWWLFTLCTVVAVASRQSALAWLTVPAIELMRATWARSRAEPPEWRGPAAAIGFTLAVFTLCSWGMNRTHAQEVMTTHMWQSVNLDAAFSVARVAAAIAFVCTGVALAMKGARAPAVKRSPSLAQRSIALVGAGLLWLGVSRGWYAVEVEHQLYQFGLGSLMIAACGALAVVGWFFVRLTLDWRWAATAVASVALVCLRGTAWDYYFADLAAIAFFATQPDDYKQWTMPTNNHAGAHRDWPRLTLFWASIITLVIIHQSTVRTAKHLVDNASAITVLCEQSLRTAAIEPADLSIAPFGFAGWHLYPHFIRHDGAGQVYIANFQNYLRPQNISVQTRGTGDQRPLGFPENIIAKDLFTIGWFERHEFILRRADTSREAPNRIDHTAYIPQPFPLSDAEWRAVIVDY
jgi:hypothetical protein